MVYENYEVSIEDVNGDMMLFETRLETQRELLLYLDKIMDSWRSKTGKTFHDIRLILIRKKLTA